MTTFVATGAGRLAVDAVGDAAAADRLLVLVHGFAGWRLHWRAVIDELASKSDLAVVAVDLPGHGDSPGVAPADVRSAAAAVTELLAAIRPDRPALVAGHSLGGLVALATHLMAPARTSGIALLASAGRIDVHPRLLEQLRTGRWDETFLARATRTDARPIVEGFRRFRPPADLTRPADVVADLGDVTVPALVAWAADDRVVSPRKSRALARAIPTAVGVGLPSGDHYVVLEQPAQVAELLLGLADTPRAGQLTEVG